MYLFSGNKTLSYNILIDPEKTQVFSSTIRDSITVEDSFLKHKNRLEYSRSAVAQDYQLFINEFIESEIN